MTHSYDHFNDLPMESNLLGNTTTTTTTTCMYVCIYICVCNNCD